MQLDTLLFFIFSVSLLTLSPGPDIMYVFLKSISDGKREAIELSLGLTSGLLFHTMLVVFGISAILNSNDLYYDIIKYFGFFYFLILSLLSILKKNNFKKKKEYIQK
jgi:threonine/homoserine/homoserine lactone efflux protein